jgi:hypothetical protein
LPGFDRDRVSHFRSSKRRHIQNDGPANDLSETTADSGKPRLQAFCPRCGTPIYSTTPGDGVQSSYTVRVGMLRQRDQLAPKKQIWWRSARPWVTALDAVPKIEKQT